MMAIQQRPVIGAFLAVCLAGGGFAGTAWADVKAGVDAWSRGDYNGAVNQWRPDAIAGNPDAQFNLAQAYKLGRGVPVDLAQAEEWYRRAALQGHEQAQDNYALALFQNGKRAEAVPWLEKSAARGEPRAQLVLGTMLFNGDAVAKDWVRAYALMLRSSASGLPQGSQTLAQMDQYIPAEVRQQGIALARQYENGRVAAQDPPELAGKGSSGSIRRAEVPASLATNEAGSTLKARPSKAGPTPPRPESKPQAVAAAPAETAAPRPEPAIAATGNWRFQVGAFRDDGNAQGIWQQIKARIPGGTAMRPFFIKRNGLTSVQIGSFASRADVLKVCGNVKARLPGTPCVPVAP